jgi:hypothetical protein
MTSDGRLDGREVEPQASEPAAGRPPPPYGLWVFLALGILGMSVWLKTDGDGSPEAYSMITIMGVTFYGVTLLYARSRSDRPGWVSVTTVLAAATVSLLLVEWSMVGPRTWTLLALFLAPTFAAIGARRRR